MKKFIWLISILISFYLGYSIHTKPKLPENVIEKTNFPKIVHIKDTITIRYNTWTKEDTLLLFNTADSIAKDYLNIADFHRFNFSHDFKPDSLFQGCKVTALAAFKLYDKYGNINPNTISKLNTIYLEPYPKKISILKIKYPIWKKLLLFGAGSIITYTGYQICK